MSKLRPNLKQPSAEAPARANANANANASVGERQGARASGSKGRRIVVMGGGVAGIAAAVRMAERGEAVTLVESRKRLGGRATSHLDAQSGRLIDNCQHVLLGCCTNLIDLYRRLGVAGRIEWHRRLFFTDGSGVIDVLEPDDLPAPSHLSRALLAFGTLTMGEKIAIGRACLAAMRIGRAERARWHDASFAEWLSRNGQPRGAIEKYWSVVMVSALNESLDRCAADYALQVLQEGFLAHEDAFVMGVSRVPLVELYDAAKPLVERGGGEVMLGASVRAMDFDAEARSVGAIELSDGRRIEADAFVSALPFDRLARVVSPGMVDVDGRLASLERFETSPIVGIHLWYDRPITTLPHLVLMRSPLQWIFMREERGHHEQGDASGRGVHVHGVISAARAVIDRSEAELIELADREIRGALASSREAELTHGRVIKEKRATFSVQPGVDAIRPPTAGAIENLLLAGDWCATGWPATMEGAARSGYLAAEAALTSVEKACPRLMVGDLQAGSFYDMLAR